MDTMPKYQKIGNILIVKRNLNVEEIDYLLTKTNCKTIVKYSTHITGSLRIPKIKIIYGKETETVHKEHGCMFKIDVSKLMWSMGNLKERERISTISSDTETVVDMFSGIGYFTIPLAKYSNPKLLYALELNPDSYNYLLENIKLNNLKNVIPILGNNQKFPLKNVADRILMGYVLTTHKFLDKAFEILKNEGGFIHYHETVPEGIIEVRPIERLKYHAEKNGYVLADYKINKIKTYSPGIFHVVIDAHFLELKKEK
ncbi:protein of unknown function Met10 [Methanococcus vannielii SB]|uniref:tRNA(Phe) (4-demethylwyosine(37)-C(7)) aminocarboxypropyltransferase n=1 Tax=Methanococcus vannielii (strain ATCC 35089 / DSM 1224 / JCM 13029 / OCM 148 / SB) TaxID=406327 RepID=A6US60_METVS|nr:class I SAM-dependent methyltransferase family protein [Methanococcus vannielii]ABR55332.1 protein of unknown function Met10 [Methanococcus vannielii SB]